MIGSLFWYLISSTAPTCVDRVALQDELARLMQARADIAALPEMSLADVDRDIDMLARIRSIQDRLAATQDVRKDRE